MVEDRRAGRPHRTAATRPADERTLTDAGASTLLAPVLKLDPARLDLARDAEFVAVRMLSSADPAAWAWATAHLPGPAITAARETRAMDPSRER